MKSFSQFIESSYQVWHQDSIKDRKSKHHDIIDPQEHYTKMIKAAFRKLSFSTKKPKDKYNNKTKNNKGIK